MISGVLLYRLNDIKYVTRYIGTTTIAAGQCITLEKGYHMWTAGSVYIDVQVYDPSTATWVTLDTANVVLSIFSDGENVRLCNTGTGDSSIANHVHVV